MSSNAVQSIVLGCGRTNFCDNVTELWLCGTNALPGLLPLASFTGRLICGAAGGSGIDSMDDVFTLDIVSILKLPECQADPFAASTLVDRDRMFPVLVYCV